MHGHKACPFEPNNCDRDAQVLFCLFYLKAASSMHACCRRVLEERGRGNGMDGGMDRMMLILCYILQIACTVISGDVQCE